MLGQRFPVGEILPWSNGIYGHCESAVPRGNGETATDQEERPPQTAAGNRNHQRLPSDIERSKWETRSASRAGPARGQVEAGRRLTSSPRLDPPEPWSATKQLLARLRK
jgi:hypothetical protein